MTARRETHEAPVPGSRPRPVITVMLAIDSLWIRDEFAAWLLAGSPRLTVDDA